MESLAWTFPIILISYLYFVGNAPSMTLQIIIVDWISLQPNSELRTNYVCSAELEEGMSGYWIS